MVGIVVTQGKRQYCIPLSSPKPKHEKMRSDRDFSKIMSPSGRCIGVLNFNNMVPVDKYVLRDVDLSPRKGDTASDRAYKELMRDQLKWRDDNRELVRSKASKLYDIVTRRPDTARRLVSRCCDFARLERVLDQWLRERVGGR